ncbi:ATP-binding protein [Bacteroides xylanisolvens]|jgi:hypothetical protein|uniref:ATP-binding protein n=1 Tax=Bacteroides xylanisolvens TaxID=371601 RepID=UPI001ABF4B1C|nr:ATP-binding protein [Bacteroides xylanisolvens]UYI75620.1 MAG: ATP-binding protein [Bacteroides xylanisolvens]
MENKEIKFDDTTIQALFGFEDAESESIDRLKEYYLKKDTYDRVVADLPVRILVGHKGTGKSALFKVAMSEEQEKGNLPILIKPDDIAELGKDDENFLLRIRQWKYGLTKIIGEKVFSEFGLLDDSVLSKLTKFGLKLSNYIYETVSTVKDNVDLLESQKLLVSNFLSKRKIVVYIDDLDRGWEGKPDDISRISALLNSVRDLANENKGISFKVSLRSDVYYLVRTSDESTDKIESSVVWCEWSNHEILVLLVKRILTFFDISADYNNLLKTDQFYLSQHLDRVFERRFQGRGKWSDTYTYKVLMSMIRKRPRDLVKLCSLSAQSAKRNNSSIIKTENLQGIFEEYSQGRIQDTINEFRSELPSIDKLIFGMKPTRKQKQSGNGYVYTTQELNAKIRNILQNHKIIFKNGRAAEPKTIAQFLFKINFLTARKELDNGEIQRKYFEENRYLSSDFVDFGYDWEVHPAFRWALQPDDITDVFAKLSLISDK